jgi:nitroreductase
MADILGFLKKLTPWIAAAASGNVPALVGMAAQTISTVTGKDVKADAESISAAISGATPEQLQALKQADQDFALKMQAMGFQNEEELEKIAAEDRANARDREEKVRDYTPEVGFYILLGVFAFFLHWLFKYSVPTDNKAIIYSAFGSLGTLVIMAATYFYGTTRQSARKDEVIAQSSPVGNGKK